MADVFLNEGRVVVEEVTSILTPAEGVSVETMLADAQLAGYDKLVEREDGTVEITWYKRRRPVVVPVATYVTLAYLVEKALEAGMDPEQALVEIFIDRTEGGVGLGLNLRLRED